MQKCTHVNLAKCPDGVTWACHGCNREGKTPDCIGTPFWFDNREGICPRCNREMAMLGWEHSNPYWACPEPCGYSCGMEVLFGKLSPDPWFHLLGIKDVDYSEYPLVWDGQKYKFDWPL